MCFFIIIYKVAKVSYFKADTLRHISRNLGKILFNQFFSCKIMFKYFLFIPKVAKNKDSSFDHRFLFVRKLSSNQEV